jgi:hypothetical protein
LGALLIASKAKASVIVNPPRVNMSSFTVNGYTYLWPTTGGTSGQCLTTDGANPQVLVWATCGSTPPPVDNNFVLLEDGTYLLLEDGTNMLLEQP